MMDSLDEQIRYFFLVFNANLEKGYDPKKALEDAAENYAYIYFHDPIG